MDFGTWLTYIYRHVNWGGGVQKYQKCIKSNNHLDFFRILQNCSFKVLIKTISIQIFARFIFLLKSIFISSWKGNVSFHEQKNSSRKEIFKKNFLIEWAKERSKKSAEWKIFASFHEGFSFFFDYFFMFFPPFLLGYTILINGLLSLTNSFHKIFSFSMQA